MQVRERVLAIIQHVLSIRSPPAIGRKFARSEGKDHRGLMLSRQSFLGLCHSAAAQLQCQPAPVNWHYGRKCF